MYCKIYKKLNCVGCPEEFKDYCKGVKQITKDYKHLIRQQIYRSTYFSIMPIIAESENAKLTSTAILDRINNMTGKKIKTNLFYINQVMQKMYKYKIINGKRYYFAKIVELDY